ncbi:MAG TPA: Fur family transcriptional regulator [Solirubrobacteraceae bacterium]|nr:Fur family transcriptional regulator [Solirubrobacteraceae bacterium]
MAAREAEPWASATLERFAKAGYRRGGAREELVRLMDAQTCALSAIELERALAKSERRVSRASIYRILEELSELGAVQRVEIGAGEARYEAVRHGHGHHHHLVCDDCGQLRPFRDEGLERAIKRAAERVAIEVSEHEVVLRGTCPACRS